MTQILSSLGADAPDASGLNETQLLDVYRTMRSIRAFEDRVHEEFATGDIPGFVHFYAGEEASATGVCAHLDPDRDTIASTHRGHGHCIAKGVDIKPMMAEIFGRRTGSCRGKGGSMHIADLSKGMLGANGIVGGGPPLICGTALGGQAQGRRRCRRRVLRRRSLQPGHHAGGDEPGVGVEPARDLRRGEQRLRRGDKLHLVGGRRQHRRPRGGVRHARRHRRRIRLLRRLRGRRARRSNGPGRAAGRPCWR